MTGSKAGGSKLRETMIRKHGSLEAWKQWMRENAAKGGRVPTTGGFKSDRELARRAGAVGGKISRRGKAKRETL